MPIQGTFGDLLGRPRSGLLRHSCSAFLLSFFCLVLFYLFYFFAFFLSHLIIPHLLPLSRFIPLVDVVQDRWERGKRG